VVRLAVPTLPGFLELTVLTRAELTAAGFEVEERAMPSGDPSPWLGEARRDHALALVVLGGSRTAPAARIWLLGAAASDRPHDLQSPPARRPSEGLTLRARTTLAVRIAEQVLQHEAGRPAHVDASAGAGARAPDAGPPAELAEGRPSRSDFAGPSIAGAPIGPGLAAAPGPELAARGATRIELALLLGLSLHPDAPSVGLDLGLAHGVLRRWFARLALSGRLPTTPLSAAGGTVRVYEAAVWTGAGIASPARWDRLVPELAIDLGLQRTALVGQGAPGFAGRTEIAWSPAIAGTIGISVDLGRSSAALVGLRVFDLLSNPVVMIDDTPVSRTGLGYEGRLSLRFAI
jgi:hypothetical protein